MRAVPHHRPLASRQNSEDDQLIFYDLDPVKGRGEEIARLAGYKALEPRFDLSPDGSRLAIVDLGEHKGEIRILNLADRKVTVLPGWDWKWQSSTTYRLGSGRETLVRSRGIPLFVFTSFHRCEGQPESLVRNPRGSGMDCFHPAFAGWPLPRLHQKNIHKRRDAAGKLLS